MLIGSVQIHKVRELVKNSGTGGSEGPRTASALARGTGAPQPGSSLHVGIWVYLYYFDKRSQESGYLHNISQFSNFEKHFKEFWNSVGQTEDICVTRRLRDSLEQRFSVLVANESHLGGFEKAWCLACRSAHWTTKSEPLGLCPR